MSTNTDAFGTVRWGFDATPMFEVPEKAETEPMSWADMCDETPWGGQAVSKTDEPMSWFDMCEPPVDTRRPSKRAVALEKLKTVEKAAFTKTKMCKYSVCKRPDCPFAHSVSEIVPLDCFFGKSCRKKKTCQYVHPGETKNDYLNKIL